MSQSRTMVKWKKIKCLAVDVDGVLTDGRIFLHQNGEWRRHFYIRDGLGLVMLRELGFKLAIITSSRAEDIRSRAKNLEIHYFYEGIKKKSVAFLDLIKKSGLNPNEIAYIGDDVIDLPIFELCGIAVAPSDAHPTVKKKAKYITQSKGGAGAVREVCDLLLKNRAHQPAPKGAPKRRMNDSAP